MSAAVDMRPLAAAWERELQAVPRMATLPADVLALAKMCYHMGAQTGLELAGQAMQMSEDEGLTYLETVTSEVMGTKAVLGAWAKSAISSRGAR